MFHPFSQHSHHIKRGTLEALGFTNSMGRAGGGISIQLCSDATRERAAHPSCLREQSQRNQTNPASAISFWLTIRGNTGVTLGELLTDTQNQGLRK